MWNRWHQTADSKDGKPWLLRFCDQIRFYPVDADELLKLREDFLPGRFKLRIEHETFRLRDYNKFLNDNKASIDAFKTHQQKGFEAERKRWEESGQLNFSADSEAATGLAAESVVPDGHHGVAAHVPGNVWKIPARVGDRVSADQALVILESMKMEISVFNTSAGVVTEILCAEGGPVQAGDTLLVIKPD